ncbi:hypothetical protein EJK48_0390 [Moraxella catarrhalis]|uniref:Uncharacterized protein n=1 Tax=Moraxella catarrhalis TaxID=480 RepID=A0A3S9QCM5_MORCA|nr:hypothetical protein EJK50_0388 [Moraxella catarrhalis]AZQ92512.1 hypothetical protein EJK53_0385 [Moraxella catarrhalis]AZQ95974.1 hypothetical protein EJK48_0390 [Moraxella catarrhalis]RUO14450.1 hypothetical protein EJK49_1591 [Moraxella catarrhalis]
MNNKKPLIDQSGFCLLLFIQNKNTQLTQWAAYKTSNADLHDRTAQLTQWAAYKCRL